MNEILDKIGNQYFTSELGIGLNCDYPENAIRFIVKNKDIQFLITNASLSLPIMFERLKNKTYVDKTIKDNLENKDDITGTRALQTLVAYFVVFEEARDPEALPYLTDFIASLPDSEKERKVFNHSWGIHYPFHYAVRAILKITDEKINTFVSHKGDDTRSTLLAFFDVRAEIAGKVTEWYKNNNQLSTESAEIGKVKKTLARIATLTFNILTFADTKQEENEKVEDYRARALRQCDEIKFLIEKAEIALPLIYKRLKIEKGVYWQTAYIEEPFFAYVIIIKETGSPESIPYLTTFINAIDKESPDIGWRSVFMQSVWAIQKITGMELPANRDDAKALFDKRAEIIEKAQKWYEEHKKK